MAVTITKLPIDPVILVTVEPGQDPLGDPGSIDRLARILEEQVQPVFLIVDVSQAQLRIDQISLATKTVVTSPLKLLHHRNLIETIFVTQVGSVRAAFRLLSGTAFGQVRMNTADTVEQAIAYCREKYAAG